MQHIKKAPIIFLLTLMLQTAFGLGKAPEYIVYQNIGKCTNVISGKVVVLKKGDFLSSASIVNIPTGGKLILLCANYKALQINTKGKYTIKSLSQQCINGNGSFTAKYFRFVWDEFTHPHSSPEAKPEKYMKTAGAVTRGNNPINSAVELDTINYFNGLLAIKFRPEKETVTVSFATRAKSQSFLFSQKSTGFLSFKQFVATKPKFGIYYWQISTSNYKKGPIQVLNLMDEQEYKKKIKAIIATVTLIEDKAEEAFMTAFLLEQNKYLAEAQQYYRTAVALNPKNKTYQAFSARFYNE
ncbi:MAG: hypothetical protein EOO47_00805 [Flavobacterium sp.]|nr:MAG: hypothetical protein EOO47_00805 [Flavobacterium sp.]